MSATAFAQPTADLADAAAAVEAGQQAQRRGDLAAAEAALRRAVELEPANAQAWNQLGGVLLQQERYGPAAEALSTALDLDGSLGVARYNLAYSLRQLGRNEAAAAEYEAYLATAPKDADAWYALAETRQSFGDSLGAADAYDTYADTETRPAQAQWVQRARDRAATLRAAAPAPSSPPASEAGSTPPPPTATPSALQPVFEALRAEDYASAFELLQQTLPDPQSGVAHAAYGSAHLGAGRLRSAEAAYRRAIPLLRGPAAAAAAFGLAEALRAQGRDADAGARYRAVVEAPGTDPSLVELARQRLAR
jgi:tetratricopeptide (TPR) repeat protein